MADLTKLGDGVQRMTETVLRGAGGRSVQVRVPRPGVADDVTEQLGLAAAAFDDVDLAPCVLRLLTSEGAERFEVQVAARAVAEVAGSEVALVLAWFAEAAGVVVDDELLRIVSVSYRDLAGVPYVYRLELTGPAAAEI